SGPALLNGRPIGGSRQDRLELALVSTGFGYSAELRTRQARVVCDVIGRVRDLRRGGSAAIDLAWTAAGRTDAYFERGISVWDYAAGALICERAGLRVRELPADDEPHRQPVVGRQLAHTQPRRRAADG